MYRKMGSIMAYRFSGVLVCVLLLGGLLSLGLSPAVGAQQQSSLSLGIVMSSPIIGSLNYLSPSENYYVTSALYLPFATYNFPPLPPLTPMLAAGWSHNSNYTGWVLNLKQNLKWDNGSPLNASDLYYSFYLYNYTGSISYSSAVRSIRILNSTAIVFNTTVPEPNAVYLWVEETNSYILPYQVYRHLSLNTSAPGPNIDNFTNFENIVADGPFVIYNYTQGENPIIFTANPYYYLGPPHLSQLILHIYSSTSSYLSAYLAGQVDAYWAWGAYEVAAALIKNVSGHSFYNIVPGGEMVATLNLNEYPFNLTQFREALAYATNVSEIDQKMMGPYATNFTVYYDNLIASLNQQIGLNPTQLPSYQYNLSMSSSLLRSIGFKQGANGYWLYPNGTPVTINIVTTQLGTGDVATATLIDSMWKAAGFQTSLQTMSNSAYYSLIFSKTGWQVAVGIGAPGYYPTGLGNLLGVFSLGEPYNVTLTPVNGVPNYNYTFIHQQLFVSQEYPIGSAQSNYYARIAATSIADTVPIIPLYAISNWQGLSDSFYWGDPSNYTGIFATQALVQPQLYWNALWTVQPISSTTTTTSTSISTTSPTSTFPSTTSSSTVSAHTNTALIEAAVVIVIIVIVVGVLVATRRR
jgi:ABC-type transport system substrate-binding protein